MNEAVESAKDKAEEAKAGLSGKVEEAKHAAENALGSLGDKFK